MLSVNVYPSSIVRTSYEKLLAKLIAEQKLISGKKLVLEISEKLSSHQLLMMKERVWEALKV